METKKSEVKEGSAETKTNFHTTDSPAQLSAYTFTRKLVSGRGKGVAAKYDRLSASARDSP